MPNMLRPSALHEWSDCEARAHYKHWADGADLGERLTDIRAWVGSAAHALLAGEPLPEKPDGAIVLTPDLPNIAAAEKTARVIAMAAKAAIEREGSIIIGCEERLEAHGWIGTADLILETPLGIGIVDLKTGASFRQAWMQLGAYAHLYDLQNTTAMPIGDPQIERIGVLHLPVKASSTMMPQNIEDIVWRNAHQIKHAAAAAMMRASEIVKSFPAPNTTESFKPVGIRHNPDSLFCTHKCPVTDCPFHHFTR